MKREERYGRVLEWFAQNMPVAETELHFRNPFELVVAVILSAQCTDKRVNLVTPKLFEKYPDARSMSEASQDELLSLISSVTFPNNKSRHLSGMSRMLAERFGSVVPEDPEELQLLPGVGRKTANVIASVIYGKPVIAVDTHVFRVSRRLGLSRGKNVLEVENDLTRNIPEHERAIAHHWLILHGRYVCVARKPKCTGCGLSAFCKYFSDKKE
ncbi:MAG: endonuclease III [Bacteroidetes bacterium HGW-Bacteroidetes-14]|jgi:endonuclease-3|nr:MAG: endonuclease III [Bacteroidetes bacterium HGW-Bacteroidetes-14]